MRYIRTSVAISALVIAVALTAACTENDSSEDDGVDIDCTAGEYYDHVKDRCIPKQTQRKRDTGGLSGSDTISEQTDGGSGGEDVKADSSGSGRQDSYSPGACDMDRDRAKAKSCGGNDCDDNDPRRSPKVAERCDTIDNNCSGTNNENLDCSFYAHEGQQLFKINPFQKTAKKVGANLPDLHDLDTHPDGTLYGVTTEGFYRFDETSKQWNQLKEFPMNASWAPKDPNGMAIDRQGKIYVTSKDTLYKIEQKMQNGEQQWWVSQVGTMGQTMSGSKFVSSGDAVINKRTLYMTSKHDMKEDHLVTLAQDSGMASDAKPIGYKNVFGLTTAWGTLYGVTKAGELIEIDPRNGDSTLVHTFNHQWYGAASTPRRNAGGSPPGK